MQHYYVSVLFFFNSQQLERPNVTAQMYCVFTTPCYYCGLYLWVV